MLGMNRVKVGIGALGAALLLVVPFSAFAQEGTPQPEAMEEEESRVGFVGTLSVESGEYSLETAEGEQVSFSLADGVIVRWPPKGEVEASALQSGQKVGVLAEKQADGSWAGTRIMIRPEKPLTEHVSGAVVSKSGNMITVVDAKGNEHVIELPEQAAAGIEVGEPLTTIVEGRPEGARGAARGRGLVKSSEVRERLERHANKVREQVAANEVDGAKAQERLDRVLGLLEANQARVADVMQKVLDRVPEQAKAAIQRVMDRAAERFDAAQESVRKAKSDVGKPEDAGKPDDAGGKPKDAGKPEDASTSRGRSN